MDDEMIKGVANVAEKTIIDYRDNSDYKGIIKGHIT